jgi:hypothetical protein
VKKLCLRPSAVVKCCTHEVTLREVPATRP